MPIAGLTRRRSTEPRLLAEDLRDGLAREASDGHLDSPRIRRSWCGHLEEVLLIEVNIHEHAEDEIPVVVRSDEAGHGVCPHGHFGAVLKPNPPPGGGPATCSMSRIYSPAQEQLSAYFPIWPIARANSWVLAPHVTGLLMHCGPRFLSHSVNLRPATGLHLPEIVGLSGSDRYRSLDLAVRQRLVTHKGADICRHERFDAVAKATSDLTERRASLQPSRRRGVSAVVNPQRAVPDLAQRSLPSTGPVRPGRALPGPGAKNELVGRKAPRS